ncbi:MAG: TspO/MBR family protein [Planctomycetota bacterium]
MTDLAAAASPAMDPSAAAAADTPAAGDGQRLLLGFCGVSIAMLAAGGWLTSLGIGDWYRELRLPPFQPPAWVFTPVWTAILAMLAVAAWRVARTPHPGRWLAFALYGAQCVLNAGWSLLFFTVARPDVAFGEIVVLIGTVASMVVAFGRIDRVAGGLLVPYLLWLLFAAAINGWIVAENGL